MGGGESFLKLFLLCIGTYTLKLLPPRGEEGICDLKGKLSSAKVAEHIRKLAFAKSNDAVKLVFLEPEQLGLIDGLDLNMVSEVKRGAKGEVEVKLLNRIALLELLSGLLEKGSPSQGAGGAESFFTAMDSLASKLDGGEK